MIQRWETAVQRPVKFLCAVAVSFAAAGTMASTSAPPVSGLLVELRDAPSHHALAVDRHEAAQHGRPSEVGDRERGRWKSLEDRLSGFTGQPPGQQRKVLRREPVGARAQLLQLERAVSHSEAEALAAQLMQQPEVAWAVPNTREMRSQTANAPSDTRFPGPDGQWWLQPVQGSNTAELRARLRGVPGFQTAWSSITTGTAAPTVVAVLDSGVTDHPELQGRLLPGFDFVSDSGFANDGNGRDADPRDPGDWVSDQDRSADPARFANCAVDDSSWHGTVIAGQIAAQTNNGSGVAGMHWGAKVLPVRVSGKCGAALADVIDAMRWAAGLPACEASDGQGQCLRFAPMNPNPARIVNLSFGGTGSCDPYATVIDELRQRGTVVVASAGNRRGAVSRPAKCAGVVGVTALNRDGFKAGYASFGAELSDKGIATVGGDDAEGSWGSLADGGLLTLGNAGFEKPEAAGYARHVGTSFAAPVVSGTLALMLSVNPKLGFDDLVQGLRLSARPHAKSDVPGVNACSADNPGRCLCTADTCGAGILDATQALQFALAPQSYVRPAAAPVVLDTPELRAAAAAGPDRLNVTVGEPAVAQTASEDDEDTGAGALSWWAFLGLIAAGAALRRRT